MVIGVLICTILYMEVQMSKKKGPIHLRSVAGGRYLHRECGAELGAARQEFRDEADINFIMSRYRATGVIDQALRGPAQFGDDLGYKTYAEAHTALEEAKTEFLKLPPEIRLELGNDPGRYRELSTEKDIRAVVQRIGAKQQRRIAAAQALIAAQAPPSPAAPAPEPVVTPPKGGK
jgi:hypothetical protein